jgi:exodeoxyribonuclease VIII
MESMKMEGFIEDVPNETYHSSKGVSKSGLDKIARSPAYYKGSKQKPATRPMEIGTAIHAAILEPVRFRKEYVVTESVVRTSKEYKEAKAIHGSELTLTATEGAKVQGMQDSVTANYSAMQYLLADGRAELSAFCVDPETGINIRARFDWLTDSGISVDVKKTQDVRADKFAKSVNEYRYHVQEAMYSFIYKQITGDDLQAFYFLAVEEEAPHSNQMFLLDDTSREIGAFYFRRDLRIYAECINSDKWPQPDNGDGVIELPNWAINNYENELEVMI